MADIDAAEQSALDDLLVAKSAHAADPNSTTRAAKQQAAEELRSIRAEARKGRPTTVAGDAFVVPDDNERI